jgi:hypothetical protein
VDFTGLSYGLDVSGQAKLYNVYAPGKSRLFVPVTLVVLYNRKAISTSVATSHNPLPAQVSVVI